MAPLSCRGLLVGIVAVMPSLAAAYANTSSSYNVDALRAQFALMDDRPKDCPPW